MEPEGVIDMTGESHTTEDREYTREEMREACRNNYNAGFREGKKSQTTVPHPDYGPCDGYGPNGGCSECTGLIQRIDGTIVSAPRPSAGRVMWKNGKYQEQTP